KVPETPMARLWDTDRWSFWQNQLRYRSSYSPGPGGRSAAPNGTVRQVYVDAALLPRKAEAYGSVATLALMSDVTENTLNPAVQEAIPAWVTAGGHLFIAGGGVRARLNAPF